MTTVELTIKGVDCAECAQGLERALARVPGIRTAQVLMAAEKAVLQSDAEPDMAAIRKIVEQEGCWIPLADSTQGAPVAAPGPADRNRFGRSVLGLLGLVVLGIVIVAVLGEFLGLFDLLERDVPQPLGWAVVALGGFPVFRDAARAAFRREITSSTLMSLGAVAAVSRWSVAGWHGGRFLHAPQRLRRAFHD